MIKQFPSKDVLRSQMNLAGYNPRTISKEARAKLKKSIKKHGLMGGLVFNERTKTLISGHQRIDICDEVNGYPEKDYTVTLTIVDVDLDEEKRMNIIFNNAELHGEYDVDMLAEMLVEIPYTEIMFSDEMMNDIAAQASVVLIPETNDALEGFAALEEKTVQERAIEKEARKEAVKEMKEKIKEGLTNEVIEGEPYVTLSFNSVANKIAFCESVGAKADARIIKGEEVAEKMDL